MWLFCLGNRFDAYWQTLAAYDSEEPSQVEQGRQWLSKRSEGWMMSGSEGQSSFLWRVSVQSPVVARSCLHTLGKGKLRCLDQFDERKKPDSAKFLFSLTLSRKEERLNTFFFFPSDAFKSRC